jgi:hypothetical protein
MLLITSTTHCTRRQAHSKFMQVLQLSWYVHHGGKVSARLLTRLDLFVVCVYVCGGGV